MQTEPKSAQAAGAGHPPRSPPDGWAQATSLSTAAVCDEPKRVQTRHNAGPANTASKPQQAALRYPTTQEIGSTSRGMISPVRARAAAPPRASSTGLMLRTFGWRPDDRSPSLLAASRLAIAIKLICHSCTPHRFAIASALPCNNQATQSTAHGHAANQTRSRSRSAAATPTRTSKSRIQSRTIMTPRARRTDSSLRFNTAKAVHT